MMPIEAVEKISAALADTNRLKILEEISKRGSVTCSEAQELTPLAQPTVSHHIKTLIECGLVTSEKDGRCVRLSIHKKKLEEYREFFKNLS